MDTRDKYSSWFILNFSAIVKKTRLTFKQLQKRIIGEGINAKEKELLIEMLYNRRNAED